MSWRYKKLKELGRVQTGTTPSTKDKTNYGDYIPFVKPAHFRTNGEIDSEDSMLSEVGLKKGRLFDSNSVLMVCIGATIGKVGFTEKPVSSNQQINGITPFEGVSHKYLYYGMLSDFFQDEIKKEGKSAQATLPIINKSKWENLKIPIPPLEEQQQIVTILDKAFAAIDQAKANIAQNIVNAKELFQSKLNDIFSQTGDGWEEKKLSELFKLKSGDGLTAKNMNDGPHPVYGGNGIAGYHNDFNFQGPEIIIGRVGALCGNVRLIGEKFWLTDNAFRISEGLNEFDFEFVVYMLNYKNLRSFARQAAQPVISNSSLKDVVLSYPKNKSVQIELRQKIQGIEEQLELLKRPYSVKLESLEELKKSLLQKAFTGELTNKEVAV